MKAEILSSSSSAARGAAGRRSASAGGTPSRSASRVDSTPRELLELSFHVIQQLVLDLFSVVADLY